MFQRVPTATSINIIMSASTARLAVYYRRVLKKFKSANNHLWFNKQCLKNKVFPKYINIKCRNQCQSAIKALHLAKIMWIKEELKKWYFIRDNLNLHQKLIHCELTNRLHPLVFDHLDREIREITRLQSYEQYIVQRNKLNKLLKSAHYVQDIPLETNPAFFTRVQNNTTTTFSKEELELLNKGLRYSPNLPIKHTDVENLAVDCEIILTDFANPNCNLVQKSMCANILKNHRKRNNHNTVLHNREAIVIQNLKTKVEANDLIISKADKGNTITIINKSIYIQRVDNFINTNNIELLKKDPTNKFQTEIKRVIKESVSILDNKQQHSLILPNPSAPVLYGLLKLHKNDCPIRPVCSYVNTPASKLCKSLNSILAEYLHFRPMYTIQNSLDLVQKINNQNYVNEGKLVSFDVKNLFTSIPINDLKNIISDKLSGLNPILHLEINNMLSTCINQNYFTFNGHYYKQLDGLPMGSPLSPLLADIYMNNFETVLFKQNNPLCNNVLWWYRYVDDILCFWKGTDRQLTTFLNYLNSFNKNIQFTLEKEVNKSINFLDLTIIRNNNKFSYGIYRKPTYTDTVIPNSSIHPNNTKHAAFYNLIHRLIHIPLSEKEFNIEFNTIYQIAVNNGYKKDLIDKIFYKKRRNFVNNQIYKADKPMKHTKIYKKLQFIPNISFKINNELTNKNVTLALYNKKTLGNLLINNKITNRNTLDLSGIYEIKCNNCDYVYIGKTTRSFKTRFKEHLRAYNLNKHENSNVAKHLLKNNHSISIDNMKVLHVQNKGLKLNYLEALEIHKAVNSKKNLMNEQLDLFPSPLLKPLV